VAADLKWPGNAPLRPAVGQARKRNYKSESGAADELFLRMACRDSIRA
jgi:hypothetical protein